MIPKRVLIVLLSILLTPPLVAAQSPREQAQLAMRTLTAPQSSNDERALAAEQLGDLGAWDAVTALASALDDPEPGVRTAAAYALYDLHEYAAPVLPALKARLSETNPDALYALVMVLGKLKVPAAELAAANARLLREGAPVHRFYTARALADELSAVELVAHVLAALQAFEADGRNKSAFWDAKQLLERLVESDGEQIAPQLLAALDHHHPNYINAVGLAIYRLPRPLPEAVPKLIVHLGAQASPSHGLMNAVLRQGSHARTALPVLHKRFREETDDRTRQQLAETMMALAQTLQPMGGRIVLNGVYDPALAAEVWSLIGEAALDDPSSSVRNTILRQGAATETARDVLAEAARRDLNPSNRTTAVRSLGAFGAASLPLLREILQSSDEPEVLEAARLEVARLSE